jgi:hypothetical protein
MLRVAVEERLSPGRPIALAGNESRNASSEPAGTGEELRIAPPRVQRSDFISLGDAGPEKEKKTGSTLHGPD